MHNQSTLAFGSFLNEGTPTREHCQDCLCFAAGCSWDKNKQKLKESAPKEMVKELPVVHVTGIEASHRQAKKKGEMNKFKCPVYKYPSRNDMNWVFDCDLNSEEEVRPGRQAERVDQIEGE